MAAFIAQEYLPSPSRAKFNQLVEMSAIPLDGLDLSALPPAARLKGGRAAVLYLFEVLNRIDLPPFDQIPDAGQLAVPAGGGVVRWVIPDTEIALVRATSGPRTGEFLFSPETVAKAERFYKRVVRLPYSRPVPVSNLERVVSGGGGWMIPYRWTLAMPASLRADLADQALWKWIGLALIAALYLLLLWTAHRFSEVSPDRKPLVHALAPLALPTTVLAATPVVAYLGLVQLNLIDEVAIVVAETATVIMFLAGAWMAWRLAHAVAEVIISSPRIGTESIDAHLIRVTARLVAIFGSAALLALGADRLGVPVYGIIAGLGVGGLALALAAQPTIENLIGGFNLFADAPIRVGDLCKYGADTGTVEGIGTRSTRIRGADRTLTTIPNAALAKMPIVNLTRRDRILIQTLIGLRYETTPEQLRYVLVRLRELLLGHPRVDPDTMRARFVGFGDSSLDVELFAYVTTRDWVEFLGVREDILLRVIEVVEQSGAAIAFPSRTLYLGRDQRPVDDSVKAAEATVRAWRDAGSLPFPNFSPEQAGKLRGSVVFPPPGSTAPSSARPETETRSSGGPADGSDGDPR